MNLWVRSQDRKKLVKSGYLTIFLSDTTWFIYSDTTTGEPFEIGKYKTEERALEVLDEIERLLINCSSYEKSKLCLKDGYDDLYIPYEINTKVYQMPKE